MEKGKAGVTAGTRDLSEGKEAYIQAEYNLSLVLADKLKGGKGFKVGRKQSAEGA